MFVMFQGLTWIIGGEINVNTSPRREAKSLLTGQLVSFLQEGIYSKKQKIKPITIE